MNQFGRSPGDPVCLAFELPLETGANMELWGLGLGAALALWRYFFDVDWDVRLRRRRRRRPRHDD
jgi:hypothetical protein